MNFRNSIYSALFVFLMVVGKHEANAAKINNSEINPNLSGVNFVSDDLLGGKSLQNITTDNGVLNIFSHGKPGQLFIHNVWIQKEAIASLCTSLIADKKINHINIFGCEFGKGKVGLEAVNYLQRKLEISVSASNNITGIDGDWVLEVGNRKVKIDGSCYLGNLQFLSVDDFDGDGKINIDDIDDDNDGILDASEAPGCYYSNSEALYISATASDIEWNVSHSYPKATDKDEVTFTQLSTNTIAISGKTVVEFTLVGLIKLESLELKMGAYSISTSTSNGEVKLQGFNGISWIDLSATKYATVVNGSEIFVNTLNPNVRVSKLRILGVSGVASYCRINEAYLILNNYNPSYNPKGSICALDTDNDLTPNSFDYDSDNDDSSDALEGGATTNTTPNYKFITSSSSGDSNFDGLADVLDNGLNFGSALDGRTDYVLTYSEYAISNYIALNRDFDKDGILDRNDIDIDNDGVINAIESPLCFFSIKDFRNISNVSTEIKTYDTGTWGIGSTVDKNEITSVQYNPGDVVNKEIIRFNLIGPVKLSAIRFKMNDYGISQTIGNTHYNTTMLQGSFDGQSWYDLQTSASSLQVVNGIQTITIDKNTNIPFKYYRLKGVTGSVYYGRIAEIYFDAITGFSESLSPFSQCVVENNDSDQLLNHMDLDSDNDGCSDAFESGATKIKDANFSFPITNVGTNGLINTLESSDNGIQNYTCTFSTFARVNGISLCTDSDSDGIVDVIDIDDDNDGVLDHVESPECYFKIDEVKKMNPLFSDFSWLATRGFAKAGDQDANTYAEASVTGQDMTNKVILEFELIGFHKVVALDFQMNGSSISTSASSGLIRLEGWNGSKWVILSSNKYAQINTGSEIFINSLNTNAKINKLRLYGISGTLGLAKIIEAYILFPNYIPSEHPKSGTCVNNIDGDALPNNLDLDSDNDQCSDHYESSVSNDQGVTFTYPLPITDINLNGFNDDLEQSISGFYDGEYTFYQANNFNINACVDSDADGLKDVVDVDDDNDGVLDLLECRVSGNLILNGDFSLGNTAFTSTYTFTTTTNVGLTESVYGISDISNPRFVYDYCSDEDVPTIVPLNSSKGNLLWINEGNNTEMWGQVVTGLKPNTEYTFSYNVWTTRWSMWNVYINSVAVGMVNENDCTHNHWKTYKYNFTTGSDQTTATISLVNTMGAVEGWIVMDDFILIEKQFYNYDITEYATEEQSYENGSAQSLECDYDKDGIVNRLDKDSDNDGCGDAFEAGNTTNSSNTFTYTITQGSGNGDQNADGLPDVVDNGANGNTALDGKTDYINTYIKYALNENIGTCRDFDHDGILDLVDIDDDNDGILDAFESPTCFYTAAEMSIPQSVVSELSLSTGSMPGVFDNNTNTSITFTAATSANASGKTIFEITPQWPVKATAVSVVYSTATNNAFGTASNSLRLEGWDGTSWIALTTITPANAVNNIQTFNIAPAVSVAYLKYRLYNINAAIAAQSIVEVKLELSSSYNASAYTKLTCVNDIDNDNLPNHIDLDSDGDNCYDTYESNVPGATKNTGAYTDSLAVNPATPNVVGVNGFQNAFESTVDNGVPNFTNSYNYAISATNNYCKDYDNDKVPDLVDLDDDNDGILDVIEDDCGDGALGAGNVAPLVWSDPATGSVVGPNHTNNTIYITNTINTSSSDMTIGNGLNVAVSAGVWSITNVNATNLTEAISNNEYVQYPIYTNTGSNSYLELKGFTTNEGSATSSNEPENYTIQIADDFAFSNPFTLYSVTSNSYTSSTVLNLVAHEFANKFPLVDNGSRYFVRVYYYGLTSQNAVQDGFGLYFNCVGNTDTDSDGIPNSLDLDSDGDGCPDAKESGVPGVLLTGNIINGVPNTTVSAQNSIAQGNYGLNGLANSLENNDSQTATTSFTSTYKQYALLQGYNLCTDSDFDGKPDITDLDDDNDGILDSNEGTLCNDGALGSGNTTALTWSDPSSGSVVGPNLVNSTAYISNTINTTATNMTIGSGLNVAVSAGVWSITNVDAMSLSQAINKNEFVQFPINTKSISTSYLTLKGFTTNEGNGTSSNEPENYTILVADNTEFINPYTIYNISGNSFTSSAGLNLVAHDFINKYPLEKRGENYFVRIYYYGLSSLDAQQDGFGLYFNCEDAIDTDNDGIPNYLDLDSDGDGCSDAIEGEANFNVGHLVSSLMSGGNSGPGYNGNSGPVILNLGNVTGNTPTTFGVPTRAGTGQGVGTSQNINLQDPNCVTTPNHNPDFGVTYINVILNGNVSTNDSQTPGSTYSSPASNPTNPNVSCLPSVLSNGQYSFSCSTPGVYTFYVPVCEPSPSSVCRNIPLVITVLNNLDPTAEPIANPDYYTTKVNTQIKLNIESNDKCQNGPSCTLSEPTLVAYPKHGSYNPSTGIFTPTTNYVGRDTFSYKICDNQSTPKCAVTFVYIKIDPANGRNITSALDDYSQTKQNSPINGKAKSNDFDPEGNFQKITSQNFSIPNVGAFTLDTLGNYIFTPVSTFSGPVEFPYTTCDNGNPVACANATIHILVAPFSNTTLAKNDINNTPMNTPVNGNVLTNDNDAESNTQTVTTTPIVNTSHGTLILNSNGTYTYTPNTGFTGEDLFKYKVCDNGTPTACDTATVIIEVIPVLNPVNNPPIANDDTGTTPLNTAFTSSLISNDIDPDGDPLSVNTTSVTNPTHGTVVIHSNGTYTYTPTNGFTGEDSFVYQICDNGTPALCDQATVTITIIATPVNNTTYANDDSGNGQVNQPITVAVKSNDTDSEGHTQGNPTTVTLPSNGTVVINTNGTITYTPNNNFVGNDQFIYQICDNGTVVACDQATVYLTILAPAINTTDAKNDINNTPINTQVSGNVLTNDHDNEGNTQIVNTTPYFQPTNGSVIINSNGTYTYTPNNGFTGEDSFVYQVCDDGIPVSCDIAVVTIQVIPILTPSNNPPIANNDTGTTPINTPFNGNLISNDDDPDGDLLTVNQTPVSTPSHGTVTIHPDGTFTYTPTNGYTGDDSFDYQVCDDGNPVLCDIATVFIKVTPESDNNTTFANDDAGIGQINEPIIIKVKANDTDAEGHTQGNPTSISQPAHGSIVINIDGTITYTPTNNYIGNDQFVYEVCDNGTQIVCDQATVYITVLAKPVNTTTGKDDINETQINMSVTGNVLTNDNDAEGNNQSVNTTLVISPSHGSVVMNTNGTYTYTPSLDFTGNDYFEYQVCDDGNPVACDTAIVSINVLPILNPINNPPSANVDVVITMLDTPVNGNMISNDNDPDSDPLTINTTPVSNPTNGTVVINPNGTFTYTPNSGFIGEDSFEYQICDDGSPVLCDIGTVMITILPDPLSGDNFTFANDDTGLGLVNSPIIIDIVANDTDPEGNHQGDPTIIEDPLNGTVVVNPDGTITYTPNRNYVGNDQFTYYVCDDGSPVACDTATVYITVLQPATNSTFAINDFNHTPINTPVSGNVLTNDFDVEGNAQFIETTPVIMPTHGTVVINIDGTYTYTPDTNYVGLDEFKYRICDNGNPISCAIAVVTIEVLDILGPNNNPPVANDDTGITPIDTPLNGNLISNDSDPNGDPLTVTTTPVSDPSNGTVIINSDGTFTYTPNPGFTGIDTFVYSICDDGSPALCDEATVTIVVTPENEENVTYANDDSGITRKNGPIDINIQANDTDPEGNNHGSPTLVSQPTHGTVVVNTDGTVTYTPNTDYTGNDQFEYQICDDGSPVACDIATVHITVLPVLLLPDLTPTYMIRKSTFLSSQTENALVTVKNLGEGPTTEPFVFTITRLKPISGFTSELITTANILYLGSNIANDFSKFDVVTTSNSYIFTSKPGEILNSFSRVNIGLKVTRTGGTEGFVSTSINILPGTGGGETPITNNHAKLILSLNN